MNINKGHKNKIKNKQNYTQTQMVRITDRKT